MSLKKNRIFDGQYQLQAPPGALYGTICELTAVRNVKSSFQQQLCPDARTGWRMKLAYYNSNRFELGAVWLRPLNIGFAPRERR